MSWYSSAADRDRFGSLMKAWNPNSGYTGRFVSLIRALLQGSYQTAPINYGQFWGCKETKCKTLNLIKGIKLNIIITTTTFDVRKRSVENWKAARWSRDLRCQLLVSAADVIDIIWGYCRWATSLWRDGVTPPPVDKQLIVNFFRKLSCDGIWFFRMLHIDLRIDFISTIHITVLYWSHLQLHWCFL